MTKMANMFIYGKNFKKSYSLEPKGRWPWNLVCGIGYTSTAKYIQMMTLGWPLPTCFYIKVKIGSFCFLYGQMLKL